MAFTTATATAPNLAPALPLQGVMQRARADTSTEVAPDWFRATCQQLERENETTWKNWNLLVELIYHYLEGRHLLTRNRQGTGWRLLALPQRTDEPVYGYNLAGFYSRVIRARWSQSRTGIRWRGIAETDQWQGAATSATHIQEWLEDKLYPEEFRQQEATHAQCGKYARYYYFSTQARAYGRKPKYEQQSLDFGAGSWFCPDCGAVGELPAANSATAMPTADDVTADSCPQCGGANLDRQALESVQVENLAGYEQVETGDFICETPYPGELKHDLSKLAHDSPYLIRKRRIRTEVLRSQFPFLHFGDSEAQDQGMQSAESLKRSVYGVGTTGARDTTREGAVEFTQVWLDPCLYSRYVLKEPYRTLSGLELPAGTKLSDVFPTGMYQAWIEGVEGCVELRDEHHRDYWVGAVYQPRAMNALGCGVEDMINANRQYDLIMSLIYMQLRTGGAPATLFDQRLLPHGSATYLGSLQNIPVNLAALEDRRLSDAVHQLMPQPPTPQHFAYLEQMNRVMQYGSNVTDFGDVLPGQAGTTATAAQLTAALSQSLFAPQLALKAECDRLGAQISLKLWKKHATVERWVQIAGKRGAQDGLWLSAADVAEELFAEIVPESYLPQTSLERRQRFQALLADVGGLPGLQMAMREAPALLERLAELHDVDFGAEDYTTAAEVCRRRIAQMQQALPMLAVWLQDLPATQYVEDPATGGLLEQPVDPTVEAGDYLLSMLQPPPTEEELGHLAAIHWCREWLTTDEGLQAPAELRAGVSAMLRAHVQGLMLEAQLTGAVQQAGAPLPPPEVGVAPPSANHDEVKNKNPRGRNLPSLPQPAATLAID